MSGTIIDAIGNPELFSRWFRDPATWAAWLVVLRAIFGLPLSDDELELFRRCTGRAAPPVGAFREIWLICGRRAGKSMVLALIAVWLACFVDWSPYLNPGERGTVMVLAADRRQARTIFRYARALLLEVPALAPLVERETAEALDLSNGVTIEIMAASFRTVRGYTVLAALLDEVAFWRSEDGAANPDEAILAALRPAMATIPAAMLLCASSPYAKRGALWSAHKRYFGQDDAPALVWRADTKTMNPTVPDAVITEAFERDPASAAAEFGAEFRTDVAGFLDRALVEAAVDTGVIVRPPIEGVRYHAFADPSGGAHDSFTLAIAHAEGDTAILDCLFERRAPFSPPSVVKEIAALLRSYRTGVVGDRYAAGWVTGAFKSEGIIYHHSTLDRSALYLDALPLFTAGRARILDNQRLVSQFAALERRTSATGKDRVDHGSGPGQGDDLCNAAAGALTLAAAKKSDVICAGPIIVSRNDPMSHQEWLGIYGSPSPSGPIDFTNRG
jgi:hypothetical protein